MDENVKDEVLLYDPLFANKPPEGWADSEKGGFFRKILGQKDALCLVSADRDLLFAGAEFPFAQQEKIQL